MRFFKHWMTRRWTWTQMALVGSWVGMAGLGFYLGRGAMLPQAHAGPGVMPPVASVPTPAPEPLGPLTNSDYGRRVVAYIHGTTPITREDLGEYLIARGGAARLDNLINKRIIEIACQQRGIEVQAREVDAALAEDLKGMKVNIKDFVQKVLKQYGKSLYEWKEDVIRPKLLLTKMVRDRVQVTDEDLQKAFEAYYGEKVDCRIIMWPAAEKKGAMDRYGAIRSSAEEFDRAARSQASPSLAATGGQLPQPVARYTTGDEKLEQIAFSLKPGEVSELIETKDGIVVLKCVKRIPADATKRLEVVKADLHKEVLERKIQAEIPKVFAELRQKANPNRILQGESLEDQLIKEAEKEVKAIYPEKVTPPAGN